MKNKQLEEIGEGSEQESEREREVEGREIERGVRGRGKREKEDLMWPRGR
jgi:hypothetical protein